MTLSCKNFWHVFVSIFLLKHFLKRIGTVAEYGIFIETVVEIDSKFPFGLVLQVFVLCLRTFFHFPHV